VEKHRHGVVAEALRSGGQSMQLTDTGHNLALETSWLLHLTSGQNTVRRNTTKNKYEQLHKNHHV